MTNDVSSEQWRMPPADLRSAMTDEGQSLSEYLVYVALVTHIPCISINGCPEEGTHILDILSNYYLIVLLFVLFFLPVRSLTVSLAETERNI